MRETTTPMRSAKAREEVMFASKATDAYRIGPNATAATAGKDRLISIASRGVTWTIGAWLMLAPTLFPRAFLYGVGRNERLPVVTPLVVVLCLAGGAVVHAPLFHASEVRVGEVARARLARVLLLFPMTPLALLLGAVANGLRQRWFAVEPLGLATLATGLACYAAQFLRLSAIGSPPARNGRPTRAEPWLAGAVRRILDRIADWIWARTGHHQWHGSTPLRSPAVGTLLLYIWRIVIIAALTVLITTRGNQLAMGAITIVVLLAASVGLKLFLRMQAPSAAAALKADSRAPILYLRAFREDGQARTEHDLPPEGEPMALRWVLTLPIVGWLASVPYWIRDFVRLLLGLQNLTLEQELARVLRGRGPVVAIGRPGEWLATLGADRLYVADDAWRGYVASLMRRAQLVVWQAADTEGTRWELHRIRELVDPERLLLVIPSPMLHATEYARVRELTTAVLHVTLPNSDDDVNFVAFDAGWTPRPFSYQWRGAVSAFLHGTSVDVAATLRSFALDLPRPQNATLRARRVLRRGSFTRAANTSLVIGMLFSIPSVYVHWVRSDPRAVTDVPAAHDKTELSCGEIRQTFDSVSAAIQAGNLVLADTLFHRVAPKSFPIVYESCPNAPRLLRLGRTRFWRDAMQNWSALLDSAARGRISDPGDSPFLEELNAYGLGYVSGLFGLRLQLLTRTRNYAVDFVLPGMHPNCVVAMAPPGKRFGLMGQPSDTIYDYKIGPPTPGPLGDCGHVFERMSKDSTVREQMVKPILEALSGSPSAPHPDSVELDPELITDVVRHSLARAVGPTVSVVPYEYIYNAHDTATDLGHIRVHVDWDLARFGFEGDWLERVRAHSSLALIPPPPIAYYVPRALRLTIETRTWLGHSSWDGTRVVELHLPVRKHVTGTEADAMSQAVLSSIARQLPAGLNTALPRYDFAFEPKHARRLRLLEERIRRAERVSYDLAGRIPGLRPPPPEFRLGPAPR